ncbi:hypothetical protein Salat_2770500 [Sesamum alatum]|uniref:Zinc knuckle CX2CX4HX4C domain-containing protein n=1 Tax=Sesamum alatum TaxID=300844 RepID=A0AAE1XLH4_9LAMI|nr:hypothetical protein Salat_2770500 [Sesamum alatum]
MAMLIGNRIGVLQHVDLDSKGKFGAHHMQVKLDITKSITCVLKMRVVLGDERLLSFSYERIPNYCYHYGCLGHIMKGCDLQYREEFVHPRKNLPFRKWLRGTSRTTTRVNYVNAFGGCQSQNPKVVHPCEGLLSLVIWYLFIPTYVIYFPMIPLPYPLPS